MACVLETLCTYRFRSDKSLESRISHSKRSLNSNATTAAQKHKSPFDGCVFSPNYFSPSLSPDCRLQFERALYHAFGIFQFEKLFILFQILIYAFMTTTTLSIDKIACIWNGYFSHRENPFREFDCNFFFLKRNAIFMLFNQKNKKTQKTELFRCQQLICEKFKTLK